VRILSAKARADVLGMLAGQWFPLSRRYTFSLMTFRGAGLFVVAFGISISASRLGAQSDEIQVYTGELETPGKASLTIHANYTPSGRRVAEFPGGVIPEHSVNGAFEWAYGVSQWFEAGTYLPVYTFTRDQKLQIDGVKLRALFAVPHAEARNFFYGVNFEFSFNSLRWDEARNTGEIRPIIGTRRSGWELIVNPILDTSFDGLGRLDFAPSARLTYNPSSTLALAIEQYADFGELRHTDPGEKQEQNLFAVADFARKQFDLETGIGFGLTKASDKLVLKTIFAHTF
jgi:hypothetical protein